MLIEGREYSSSVDQAMASPCCCSTKSLDPNNCGNPFPDAGDEKEWEEARCPICMEHPHNAVLLRCSSQEKGCRPFICDTSYRHSYCLDQLQKSASAPSAQSSPTVLQTKLTCPLCRGVITGWDVVQPARTFMNSKTRTCALETCDFSGNYDELRKHARREHSSGRPSEASPTRQSNWDRLERERESEDAFAHWSYIEYDLDGGLSFDEWVHLRLYEWVHMLFDEWVDMQLGAHSFSFSRGISDILGDEMYINRSSSMAGSGSSRQRHTPQRAIESINFGSRSNNLVRFTTPSSRSRSNYPYDNGRNTSRLRSSYQRENAPSSLRTRSTYPRENGSTTSTTRSSYYRQRASGRSRTNSSNRREFVRPRSRARLR